MIDALDTIEKIRQILQYYYQLHLITFLSLSFDNKWINLIRVASWFIGVKFWAISFQTNKQTNKQTLGQKHTCITYQFTIVPPSSHLTL